jgi:uncharacterized protein (DUF1697 family)
MPKVWQEHGRHGSVFGHAACNPPLFLQRLTKSQREVISYLSKIEKRLGVAVTARHWNTVQKIVQILNKS